MQDVSLRQEIYDLYGHSVFFNNYDFGRNWAKVVHVLKTNAQLLENLQNEMAYYMFKLPHQTKYTRFEDFKQANPNIPPYDIMSNDGYATIILDLLNEITSTRNNPNVSQCYWRRHDMLLNKMDQMENHGDQKEYEKSAEAYFAHWDKLEDICQLSWKTNPYFIAHWVPFGQCHLFNSCFSYSLAKLMFPDYAWQVVSCDEHTTVLCIKERKVFDILYWGCDCRLEDVVNWTYLNAPKEYKCQDNTLGGKLVMQSLCSGFNKNKEF